MIEILITISAILNLALGIIVFKKAKSKVQKNFSFLTFLITFWIFFNIIYYLNPRYPYVNFTYSIGAILIVSIFLWIVSYSNFKLEPKYKVILFTGGVIMLVTSLIPDKFITDVTRITSIGFNVKTGPLFIAYTIPAVLILFIAGYLLIRALRQSTGLKRLQLNYVVMGFIIPIIIIALIDFVSPVFFGMYDIGSLDVLTSVIFAGFISFSILKYRFMDIQLVIRKSIAHFFSLAIILFLYIYILFLLQGYFVKEYGWSDQSTTIGLVIFIVLTIEPLRRFLFKFIEKLFYSKSEEIQEETGNLRVSLVSTMQFDSLINKIKSSLGRVLNVQNIQFMWLNRESGQLENYKSDKNISLSPTGPIFQYLKQRPEILITEEIPYLLDEISNGEVELLKNAEKKLKSLEVAMVLPIGEPGELVGAFFFGNKKDKEAFTSDNIEYLSKLQPQMTGAIANALLYKQAVERITKQ